jgi:RNA polymerase primary sigma factor
LKNFKVSQIITDRKDASLKSYFRDVSKLSLISSEKEIELAERIKRGDKKAEKELVQANLRFVISVAKSYQGKGLDLVDLIQEGNCGLIEAAHRYDSNKGIKFISYAVWWIRQAIMKAISEQCRTVRVPMNQISNYGKVNKATIKFIQNEEREPSNEELEELTNLSDDKINYSRYSNVRTVSLEYPIGDEDNCLIDIIPNENVEEVDDIDEDQTTIKIEKVLAKLPIRESDVIRMIFGIGTSVLSKDEIAYRFGISNERVRQVQNNALDRIRNNYKGEISDLI